MKANRRIAAAALAGLCLSLTSCIDSQNPLCSPENAKVDAAILGIWRVKAENGDLQYYHIARAGARLPEGVLRIVVVSYAKNGSISRPGEMFAFATVIGANRYLNVALVDDKDIDHFDKPGWKPNLVKGYILVKYQVNGDALMLWNMDQDAKRQMIDAGKAKGTVTKNAVYFTDTSESVAKLLAASKANALFTKKPATGVRVATPDAKK
jgi:hypothetical protein